MSQPLEPTKGEQNGCRHGLGWHLSWHRRLPAPPGAALRVAFRKLCRSAPFALAVA